MSCYDSLLEGICDLLRKDRVYRSKAFEALEILEQRPFLAVHFKSGEEVRIPFVEIYGQQPKIKTERHCLEEKILMAFEWQKILDNSLIYRVVQVGHTPFGDAHLDKNTAILQDMVEVYKNTYPIESVEVLNGIADDDGMIVFRKPFIAACRGYGFNPETGNRQPLSGKVNGRCTHFPLEIGSCPPARTRWHLGLSRCIARFPYNYDFVVFLENVGEREY